MQILEVLKKGMKQKEVLSEPNDPYRPWCRQFKWDQKQQQRIETGNSFMTAIPKFPQMNQSEIQNPSVRYNDHSLISLQRLLKRLCLYPYLSLNTDQGSGKE